MRRLALTVLLALTFAGMAGMSRAEGCGNHPANALTLTAADEPGYVLAAPSVPAIQVGRQFALLLTLCNLPDGAAVRAVDATMPAHRHGMNYRARVRPGDAPGTWRAEGLLMHMPGEWRLTVDAGNQGAPIRYAAGLTVAP